MDERTLRALEHSLLRQFRRASISDRIMAEKPRWRLSRADDIKGWRVFRALPNGKFQWVGYLFDEKTPHIINLKIRENML